MALQHGSKHLPCFSRMERDGMNLTIEFSNEAELLSKTINDREKMERFGIRVFINLLDGLAELSKLKIIHRYLSPSSIYVSEDY